MKLEPRRAGIPFGAAVRARLLYFPLMRRAFIRALQAFSSIVLLFIAASCPGKKGGSGEDGGIARKNAFDGGTAAYAILTGKLSGSGVVTLDGKTQKFEPIAKGKLEGAAVEYFADAPTDARTVAVGGDFAGTAGVVEYPAQGNAGRIRIFLDSGGESIPVALSVVLGEKLADKAEISRMENVTLHYRSMALVARAQAALDAGDWDAAVSHARKALEASPDNAAANTALARALIAQGNVKDAFALVAHNAPTGRLTAYGYEIWMDSIEKSSGGAAALKEMHALLSKGVFDASLELEIRGGVYHRRLAASGSLQDVRANLQRYAALASEEEIPDSSLPIARERADEMLKRIGDALSGKPAQLYENRFEDAPEAGFDKSSGVWKVTKAKGESFYTANPNEKGICEIVPAGDFGFTSDMRISLRIRLRENGSTVEVSPRWSEGEAYRVVLTSSKVWIYRARPARQDKLSAALLGEGKLDVKPVGEWVTLAVTARKGLVEATVNGKTAAIGKDKKPLKGAGIAIMASGGIADIDDLVVTSL